MSVIDLPDEWPFCVCANKPALRRLRDIMRLMEDNRDGKIPFKDWYPGWKQRQAEVCPDPLWELIMHWFDSIDWGEHGSGVNSSWLTHTGKAALETLESLDLEDPN